MLEATNEVWTAKSSVNFFFENFVIMTFNVFICKLHTVNGALN